MSSRAKIAILIMAAGNSSRMGRPKQLLKWKNTNLLDHTISKAIRLKPGKVFVVLGANANMIIPEIRSKEVNLLINQSWENGLGSSISMGVSTILETYPDIKGVLIMLADQPLIGFDHYLNLLDAFSSGSKGIIATKYSDEKLGAPALFESTYFRELCGLSSDFGAKQLFNKYPGHVISIKNEQSKLDIDTQGQYDQLFKENH